jgi:membrane glycosyltransferase
MRAPSSTTPDGLQSVAELASRRRRVAVAALALYAALLCWLAAVLAPGGWSASDVLLFLAVAAAAPWSVLGFCNAVIGFWLLHGWRDALAEVAPFVAAGDAATPLRTRTAMLLTLRNEDAARAMRRLRAMKASVDATGEGACFDWFVLSDTDDAYVADAEEREFAIWRAEEGVDGSRLHYRRRVDNFGYKAGNVRDFCARWGSAYDFMIPLDADSLMDGATILRLARIGEAHPKIGILQSLVVGAPSRAAFARIFQFGMRAGMRSYTMGATWWAGDCGPFWGHNALVRIAPFFEHCDLPTLPDGRQILSHDQIEAALMRRAGYEVRVLPVESGSYEENPPTLLDFASRDLRWCRGNLQYGPLLSTPGLPPMSRFHLVWAISMFLGAPASTLAIALALTLPMVEDISTMSAASAAALYACFLLLHLAPKLAGYVDVAMTPGELSRYGGGLRFACGAMLEIVSSFLIGAVTSFNTTLYVAGLAFRSGPSWARQERDAHGLTPADCWRALWPHLAFGAVTLGIAAAFAPSLALWSLPLTLGYVAAISFALVTANRAFGDWLRRQGLCAIPEEIEEPPILRLSTVKTPRESVPAEGA